MGYEGCEGSGDIEVTRARGAVWREQGRGLGDEARRGIGCGVKVG